MPETRTYGYARVSTTEQNLDRQLQALTASGVDDQFIRVDKQSGKDFDRVAYQYLKTELREGDTLVVKELDRLGRNYEGIKKEWQELTERGVHIAVIDMPMLDTRKYKDGMEKVISNIVLELLSYISENERERIRQRQREGIAIAKAKGKHLGRPFVTKPDEFDKFVGMWSRGEITAVKCMVALGLKKNTFYEMVKRYETSRTNS